ncbi:reverse transcriptase [Elysia marginata]|uniref:Reverse transcriptase n=1 Tax=Elysia marginata TaxID=1093978 RepID=A0AAV4JRM2_9GAST|nr:reverse transcriptase [Elysia marginata]
MIWEVIQRAISEKLNPGIVSLDLTNAYGSVPLEMILRMYRVPVNMQLMLDGHFSGFRMRFSTSDYTASWINLKVGFAMGYTISHIQFVMSMEGILKAAWGSAGLANVGGGCSMPPLKAFIDDTTTVRCNEDEKQRMLARLDTLMS